MLNLLECNNLTKEELIEFLNLGLPKLKEMELKNNWDFFVNEIELNIYCNQLFQFAIENSSQKKLFNDKRNNYPKIKEIKDFWDMVNEPKFFEEENKRIKRKENIAIWKIIYDKLINYINELY